MTPAIAHKGLLTVPAADLGHPVGQMAKVARAHGIGRVQQYAQLLALRLSGTGLRTCEYYDYGLYAKGHSRSSRAQFLGARGSERLNRELAQPGDAEHAALMTDKAALTFYLAERGLATTATQAVVGNRMQSGALPMLKNVGQILSFLTGAAQYPLFAKPVNGELTVGSARIERLDDECRFLQFSNGRCMDLIAFAEEVMRDHAKTGFMFQTAVRQHPLLTAMAGSTLGTIRIVTATEEAGAPRPLYALWKIPAPAAMSDSFGRSGAMLAHVDVDTGEILRVRRGKGLKTEHLDHHPTTGRRLTNQFLPHWRELRTLASEAHWMFGHDGVLGWDIGISAQGPQIVSCTDAPLHRLYQLASGEGVMNDRFAPVFRMMAKRQAAAPRQAKTA
ncbi:sugar-transfer associated ATP-grasp domain-containing protein [Marinovum sp. KMM 9879]